MATASARRASCYASRPGDQHLCRASRSGGHISSPRNVEDNGIGPARNARPGPTIKCREDCADIRGSVKAKGCSRLSLMELGTAFFRTISKKVLTTRRYLHFCLSAMYSKYSYTNHEVLMV